MSILLIGRVTGIGVKGTGRGTRLVRHVFSSAISITVLVGQSPPAIKVFIGRGLLTRVRKSRRTAVSRRADSFVLTVGSRSCVDRIGVGSVDLTGVTS